METGTYLSLNEAAKLTGKAKSTLSKALKSGKLSYVSKDATTGAYEIDPAELLRVFPKTSKSSNGDQKETNEKPHGNSALETEVKQLRERLADKDDVIADLRRRLDSESQERIKLTTLITDQRENKTQIVRSGLWSRVFGQS